MYDKYQRMNSILLIIQALRKVPFNVVKEQFILSVFYVFDSISLQDVSTL